MWSCVTVFQGDHVDMIAPLGKTFRNVDRPFWPVPSYNWPSTIANPWLKA